MKPFTRSLTSITGTLLLSLLLSSPSWAKQHKWTEKSDSTIVEFAQSASGEAFDFDENGQDFDILVAALIATGAVGLFDGTDFTVFAPNDQAFYNLTGTESDAEAFNAVLDLVGGELGVVAVLSYHVTEGVRNSRSVTRANSLTMLDGNTVSYESGLLMANQSEAGLISIDNRLADGMVHVIDTVLLP